MLQTSIRTEHSMFRTLTKRKIPKRKTKLKMGKKCQKRCHKQGKPWEDNHKKETWENSDRIKGLVARWHMQSGHYLIKMEKTRTRKMWNSRYSLMYIFGIICSDSDVLALPCTLPPLFHTNSIMPVVCPSGRTLGTDISRVWLLGTTNLSPSSQQT